MSTVRLPDDSVDAMARYLREVRRVTGSWPKALILHPLANVEDVRRAIRLAKSTD